MPLPLVQKTAQEKVVDIDQVLPESGNWIGFLHILLKTELEMSADDESAKAGILEDFGKIATTGAAKAYIQSMGQKIKAARNGRGSLYGRM